MGFQELGIMILGSPISCSGYTCTIEGRRGTVAGLAHVTTV
jgi:hypothetical protein